MLLLIPELEQLKTEMTEVKYLKLSLTVMVILKIHWGQILLARLKKIGCLRRTENMNQLCNLL